MNTETTADGLYGELVDKSTNMRQRQSLERIKLASDYLDSIGLKISPSTVERYCIDHQWDGPKAQSIRNSKDVLYRYLLLRQSGQKLNDTRKTAQRLAVADETVRAYIALLEQERDQAVAAQRRVEAGLRKIPGIPVDDLIRVGFGGEPREPKKPNNLSLSSALRSALKTLLDEKRLNDFGFEVYKDRIRQKVTRNVFLDKDHVQALRELLAPESGEQDQT